MAQDKSKVWKRNEVQSPCINICVIHSDEQICTGCWRTIDEITQWSKYDPDQRREIMDALPSRASRLQQRRGGRKGRLNRQD